MPVVNRFCRAIISNAWYLVFVVPSFWLSFSILAEQSAFQTSGIKTTGYVTEAIKATRIFSSNGKYRHTKREYRIEFDGYEALMKDSHEEWLRDTGDVLRAGEPTAPTTVEVEYLPSNPEKTVRRLTKDRPASDNLGLVLGFVCGGVFSVIFIWAVADDVRYSHK